MDNGYVETNSQKLYYEIHGEGDPLLLIMGLGDDSTAWMLQTPALAEHFKVIVFDNRDVGRSSEAKGPYTIKDMAEDTAGLMDGLGIKQAHVVGASMGGAIAQELVIAHPDTVRKLVLACTMGHFARFRIFMLESAKFVKERDLDKKVFLGQLLFWCMTHAFLKDAEAVDQMMDMMRNPPFPQSPEAFSRQVDATMTFDALDRLGSVKVTTLVLLGDQDILTPPWAARELAGAIPAAKLQILEGGAHGFLWEIPEKVNRAIIEFLKD
ncbi:MAG TPA: alpha/beta hydrolase [Thermodesulfobacteriota bacterium]|nr:alpha/beta hydrolase [Thermodesulfobacteriota bacterium]